jgi:hypothetical protein
MESVPPKVFHKLVETNQNISYAINTLITEYDIQRCHPSCMYFIKGPDVYKELISMPKLESNILIGKMIRDDPTLTQKIGEVKLKYFNEFCRVNNIKESNFISSTVDSMLLVNKKPLKTKFENGVINFRNKDGEFTSYIRLSFGREIEILYDGMNNNVRVKGVNADYVNNNPTFMRLFKQLLMLLENSNNLLPNELFRKLNYIRNKYINSKDPMMWASILDGNNFVYSIANERVLTESVLPESSKNIMVKTDNYVTFILPLIKLCFKPH